MQTLLQRWPLLLLHIATALMLLRAAQTAFSDRLFWDVEWISGGLVTAVLDKSPAELAGFMPLDWILEVDGLPPKDMPSLLPSAKAGDRLQMLILRDGERKTLSYRVMVAPTENRLNELMKPFVGLSFWVIGLILVVLRPSHQVASVFLASSVVATLMLSAITLRLTLPGGFFVSNLLETVIGVLAIHNYALFPSSIPKKALSWLMGAMYGLLFLMGLAAFGAVYWTSDPIIRSWQFRTQELFTDLGFLLALLILLWPTQKREDVDLARRKRLLVFGLTLGLLPLVTLYRLPTIIGNAPWVSYVWVYPFIVFIPITYGTALLRGELGGIDRFLNRSLVYSLLLGIFLGSYFVLFWSLESLPRLTFLKPFVSASIALLAALGFPYLRDWLQKQVDKLLYGDWYDFRSVIDKSAMRLNYVRDGTEMAAEVREILGWMRFEQAALLLPNAHSGFRVVDHFGLSEAQKADFNNVLTDEAVAILQSIGKPVFQSEILEKLQRVSAAPIYKLSFNAHVIWVPLISREQLQGVLWLGRRKMEAHVGQEDMLILRTLADQLAATLETVTLIEHLKRKVAELNETKQRLTEGREAERLHLSRELHDGPIQELYRAGHLLGQWGKFETEKELIEQVAGLQRHVAETLRNICLQLRPPLLFDLGLETALKAFADEVYGIEPASKINWLFLPGDHLLDERTRLAIYRIVQEALNNAFKHAKATEIWVSFESDAEGVRVEIRDNGVGFNPPKTLLDWGRKGHFGQMGMAERAEMIGGKLLIMSEPKQGTKVCLEIPNNE